MSWLITAAAPKTQAAAVAKITGVPIQTSVLGQAIPILFGTTRISANLVWYGDFKKNKVAQASSQSSGKGGLVGGSTGKGQQGSATYTYSASFEFGICEGPIGGVGTVFISSGLSTLAKEGLSLITGAFGQSAWSYLTTAHPTEALGYSGLAYVAASNFNLGTSPQFPTTSFEVKGLGPFGPDGADVNAADVVIALLTDAKFGSGFPSANLDALTSYRTYMTALDMWVSPAYTTQQSAAQMLQEIADLTNSVFVWTGGTLKLIPRGDETLTANGSTYIPPQVPLFDLADDDFQNQGPNTGPVQLSRTQTSDSLNSVVVEYLNRSRNYNVDTVEAKDQARIDLYGLRPTSAIQGHLFCIDKYARMSAQLALQRQIVRNQYRFRLDGRFLLLDVMDLVTITDADLGLNKQWVRILEIDETAGGFDILAEEYLNGTGTAAVYSLSQSSGFAADYNAPPDAANPPLFFEPTDQLAGQLEVLIAATGSGPNWGGCDVWMSIDGDAYSLVGRIKDGARMGVLTAPLPSIAEAASDTTLDTFNTLSIDISESGADATLVSVSSADAQALSTACFVDGEYISFGTATLTGAGLYDLTFLVRGAYGTSPELHAAGSKFCRVDQALLAIPFTQDRAGQAVSIKLCSMNVYGGGLESLASVPAYPYTIVGTALASPLPDVTNFRAVYVDNVIYLDWDEITDFRQNQYEIRKGPTWASGQSIGRFAHPTAPTFGEANYWIAAVTIQSGLTVYSETPVNLDLSGTPTVVSLLNVVKTWDEAATAYSGTLSGFATGVGNPFASVSTSPQGDLTAAADVTAIPDIADYGGQGDGTYEIPVGHEVDIGYVAAAKVTISWTSGGANVADNILTLADYLSAPDILSSADAQLANVYPEVAVSQVANGNVKVLLHFNGTDTSTTILDEKGHTWTAHGDAQLDIGIAPKFGTAALLCDGTGDYIDTPDSADFTLGASDFTIDFWFYVSGGAGTNRFLAGQCDSAQTSASTSFVVYLSAANALAAYVSKSTSNTNVVGTTAITTTGWHHGAFVRTGNVLKLFLDGVQEGGDVAFTGSVNDSANTLSVGRAGELVSPSWFGSADDFRMTVGVARWTANFTPPTTQATDDLLWGPWSRFSGAGTYQGRGFKTRMQLKSLQADIVASLLSYTFTVQVPLREDHITDTTLAGGTTYTFATDGAYPGYQPFNAGPGGAALPHIDVTILNRTAGDEVFFTSLSLSGVTIQIKNAGVGVARNVKIQVIGY